MGEQLMKYIDLGDPGGKAFRELPLEEETRVFLSGAIG